LFEINGFRFVYELKMVFGTLADIGFVLMKGDMFLDKIPIAPFVADNFIADGIGHGQVRLGSDQVGFVRRLACTGAAGAKSMILTCPLPES
jgi:hypothetical protein